MALAAALQRLRISVLVLERAPRLGEVGAGLGVLPNAVRALAAIGVSRAALPRARDHFGAFAFAVGKGRSCAEIDFEACLSL